VRVAEHEDHGRERGRGTISPVTAVRASGKDKAVGTTHTSMVRAAESDDPPAGAASGVPTFSGKRGAA
jgi:hypothetical protein